MILSPLSPQRKRFTTQEYHRLIGLGLLGEDDHIELIRGELVHMAAKEIAHETCITRLLRVLLPALGPQATLRCQSPITLALDGEPDPDFTIVNNRPDDYTTGHLTPKDILLWIFASNHCSCQ